MRGYLSASAACGLPGLAAGRRRASVPTSKTTAKTTKTV